MSRRNLSPLKLVTFLAGLLMLVSAIPLTVMAGSDDEDRAHHLLMRLSNMAQHVSYEGVFVYSQGETMEAVRVSRKVHADGTIEEQFSSLDGRSRQMAHRQRQTNCQEPGGEVSRYRVNESTFPFNINNSVDNLKSHYHIAYKGEGRIAGRQAHLIWIMPKDEYRHGYRLWLDAVTGLLLKSEMVKANKKLVESYMFTQLSFSEYHETQEPESLTKCERQTNLTELPVTLNTLPPGFRPIAHKVDDIHGAGKADHILLNDGLASVSVFVEKSSETSDNPTSGMAEIGTMCLMRELIGDRQVTVVGVVPMATVKQIMQGIAVNDE